MASNFYFYDGGSDRYWSNLANWFMDAAATIPASLVPWVDGALDSDIYLANGATSCILDGDLGVDGSYNILNITGVCYMDGLQIGDDSYYGDVYAGNFVGDNLVLHYSSYIDGGYFEGEYMSIDGTFYGGTIVSDSLTLNGAISYDATIVSEGYVDIGGTVYTAVLTGYATVTLYGAIDDIDATGFTFYQDATYGPVNGGDFNFDNVYLTGGGGTSGSNQTNFTGLNLYLDGEYCEVNNTRFVFTTIDIDGGTIVNNCYMEGNIAAKTCTLNSGTFTGSTFIIGSPTGGTVLGGLFAFDSFSVTSNYDVNGVIWLAEGTIKAWDGTIYRTVSARAEWPGTPFIEYTLLRVPGQDILATALL